MMSHKNNYGKKLMALLMTLMMLMSVVPANLIAFAVEDETTESQTAESTTENETTEEKTTEETTEEESVTEDTTAAESTTEAEKTEEDKTTSSVVEADRKDITVTVVGTDGMPLKGIKVTYTDSRNDKTKNETTNGDGVVIFSGIDVNEEKATITVKADGFRTETKEIALERTNTELKITLYRVTVRKAEVNFPDGLKDGEKDYKVEIIASDDSKTEVDINNGTFTFDAVEGVEYTVKVLPGADKLLEAVTKKITSAEDLKFDINYIEYDIYVGDEVKCTAHYGETVEIDANREGFAVSEDTVVTCNGEKVDYKVNNENNDKIIFVVYGTTMISLSYSYPIEVISGANGSVKVGKKTVASGEKDVAYIKEGKSAEFSVYADKGYRIDKVTFNGKALVNGDNDTVKVEDVAISGSGTLEATFKSVECDVYINIENSKAGVASLAGEGWEISVDKNKEVDKTYFKLSIESYDAENDCYTFTVKSEVDGNHFLELKDEKGATIDYKDGIYTVTTKKTLVDIRTTVSPKKYEVTYVNPLVATESTAFTVEDGVIELPATEAKGYKFLGWAEKAPDAITSEEEVISTLDCEAQNGDLTLYAVYVIDSISVIAKSENTFDGSVKEAKYTTKDGVINDEISKAYFGNDVELVLGYNVAPIKDGSFTAFLTDSNNASGDAHTFSTPVFKYDIREKAGECAETEISVSAKIELIFEGETFVYATEEAAKFTVNQDDIAPTLTVSEDKKAEDATANKIEFEDKGSGVFAVQYAVIDMVADAENAEGVLALLESVKNGNTEELESDVIAKIKNALRNIDFWENIDAEELGVATHEFVLADNEYIVYRVVDMAGNDVYSSFDRTVPEVTDVKYSYFDNSSDEAVKTDKGSIYTDKDVTVTATVTDRNLFFKKTDADIYDNCKLVVYAKNDASKFVEFASVFSTERFSLFYDKWDVKFVISRDALLEAELTDKELGFEVIAYDQTGNVNSYTFADTMVIETVAPEIKVTYSYKNHNTAVTDAIVDAETTVYSKDGYDVKANITISGDYFDPYCDTAKSVTKAEAVITESISGKTQTLKFTKDKNIWTASAVLSEEGEYSITVKAVSQAGNASEYATGTVVIDRTDPVIDVTYALNNRYPLDDANDIYYGADNENGTFTVNVTDNYLAPFFGEDKDASTVAVTIKGGENTLELSKADFEEAYIATANVFEEQGTYTLTVNVTDEAGNKATYQKTLHSDRTVPEITNVSIDKAHKLSFGNFFNQKVELVVVCNDGKDSFSSGCKEVYLHYGKESIEGKVNTATDTDTDIYTYTYIFTLPFAEVEKIINDSYLSLTVIDNVNNESTVLKIDALEGDELIDDYVLYETEAPVVTTPFDNDDSNVFYVEAVEGSEEKTYWLLDGQSIKFNVSDIKEVAYSGLDNVSIKLEKQETGDIITKGDNFLVKESEDEELERVGSEKYEFTYAELAEGKNTFTVYAIDNAGNPFSEEYVVYKDNEAPAVTALELAVLGEEFSGNNVKFGNFYNGDIELDVTALDKGFSSGIASIEVNYVTGENVYTVLKETNATADGVEEKSKTDGSDLPFIRNFECEYIENAEGYFTVKIIDNVGNVYTTGAADQVFANDGIGGNMTVNHLMFEKSPADIKLSASEHTFMGVSEETGTTVWYNTDDITISSVVTDIIGENAVSGLKSFVMKLNGEAAVEKTLNTEEKITDDETQINLSGCGEDNKLKAVDGENTITVETVDNASNESSAEIRVCVDRVKPAVTSFSFKRVGDKGEYAAEKYSAVTVTDYGYYFAEDTEVTVYVKDFCPSSGIKEVHFSAIPVYAEYNGQKLTQITDKVSTECVTECKFKDSTENGSEQTSFATFVVPAGFKGQIYAYVVDNVDNNSLTGDAENYDSWKHPHGLIVETQQMHDSHESIAKHVTIAEKTSPVRYLDGDKNPLYNDNAEITLTVIDTYSGIKNVEYSVQSAYDTANNYSHKLENIAPGGEMLEGWEYSTELNLVTTMRKTITVSNNSNDIVVKVKMTDNSGNTTEEEFVLSIDKDAPIVTVTFDKGEADDDEEYTGFFNCDRKMKISIVERNFDPEKTVITATKDLEAYGINTSDINSYSFVPTDKTEDGTSIQYFEYVLVHDFTEDGDYEIAIDVTDLAENNTKDKNVDYGSAAAKEVAKKFTVDKTKPVINVTISGVEGVNSFYREDLAFTVTIEEHNYAAERYTPVFVVKRPVTGEVIHKEIPAPAETHNEDTHTYTYSFTEEYTYELQSVTVKDMAGNDDKDDTVYVASLDSNDPVIDISYTATNKKGKTASGALDRVATNAETFRPVITISDAFLDTNSEHYDLTLSGNYNGVLSGGSSSALGISYDSDSKADSANNLYVTTVSYNNFGNKEITDDIYVLKVSAKDQSGRVTEKSAMFSVNRFGSTFMVDDNTNELLDKYYTNKSQDIKLIQINAAEIEDSRITMTKDGVSEDLVAGTDYEETKSAPSNVKGDSKTSTNWYECVYDIDEANFGEDGEYSITVYTGDSAENNISSVVSKRTINLFKDKKSGAVVVDEATLEAPVNFLVDTVKPTTSVSGLDKSQYFSGSHEFTYYANDDVKLKSVELYVSNDVSDLFKTKIETVNGEDIKNGKTYTLKEKDGDSKGYQYVTIVATDMAENTNEEVVETITVQVTTNPVQWFLGNTIAKMIAATVLIAAIIVIIILIKRKKEKEEGIA